MPDHSISSTSNDRLPVQIGAATLARFVINVSRRFLYPFAPAISRGLGVPLPAVTSLIAVNQATGLLSPFFGPLSDRWGYRVMLLLGMVLLVVGMWSIAIFPIYVVAVIGIFLGGLAKSIYDPALQAYIGERVDFRRRGMVIGLVEMSWAGATLFGIPLIGVLMSRWGWQSAFWVLGGLALASLGLLGLVIPSTRRPSPLQVGDGGFRQAWRTVRGSRTAMGALIFGFLLSMANDNLFVVYGAWLESGFQLGMAALGGVTTVIGVAELAGETLVATVSDRIGLKRAIILGLLLTIAGYLLLPFASGSLVTALAVLFFVFISFEFTVVTSFPLMTEVLPAARGTMMAGFLAVGSLGRMVGAMTGGLLWLWGGIPAVGIAAAGFTAAGLVAFLWGMRNWR
jgi:predicted MFS family arabinose efflux permease